jgi:hypothetical protein
MTATPHRKILHAVEASQKPMMHKYAFRSFQQIESHHDTKLEVMVSSQVLCLITPTCICKKRIESIWRLLASIAANSCTCVILSALFIWHLWEACLCLWSYYVQGR